MQPAVQNVSAINPEFSLLGQQEGIEQDKCTDARSTRMAPFSAQAHSPQRLPHATVHVDQDGGGCACGRNGGGNESETERKQIVDFGCGGAVDLHA